MQTSISHILGFFTVIALQLLVYHMIPYEIQRQEDFLHTA